MATLWCLDAKKRAEFSWVGICELGMPSFYFSMWIETPHALEGGVSRDAACNLERCIDSMWMLTTALTGSRLQGQECKRETAAWSSEHTSVLLSLSSLTYTAHSLFLHIDNTKITPTVRVIARQLSGKNCLAAIFASRHQDASLGPLGRENRAFSGPIGAFSGFIGAPFRGRSGSQSLRTSEPQGKSRNRFEGPFDWRLLSQAPVC